MRPVSVSVEVEQPRDEVFAFLDVMANHQQFTDHLLTDWTFGGPERGVGAQARVRAKAGGRVDEITIEVISAEPPRTIVERNVGAGGQRVATGTYVLDELRGGGTRITLEYAWQSAPTSERLFAPVVRPVMRRANRTALERLKSLLAARGSGTAAAPSGGRE